MYKYIAVPIRDKLETIVSRDFQMLYIFYYNKMNNDQIIVLTYFISQQKIAIRFNHRFFINFFFSSNTVRVSKKVERKLSDG